MSCLEAWGQQRLSFLCKVLSVLALVKLVMPGPSLMQGGNKPPPGRWRSNLLSTSRGPPAHSVHNKLNQQLQPSSQLLSCWDRAFPHATKLPSEEGAFFQTWPQLHHILFSPSPSESRGEPQAVG